MSVLLARSAAAFAAGRALAVLLSRTFAVPADEGPRVGTAAAGGQGHILGFAGGGLPGGAAAGIGVGRELDHLGSLQWPGGVPGDAVNVGGSSGPWCSTCWPRRVGRILRVL